MSGLIAKTEEFLNLSRELKTILRVQGKAKKPTLIDGISLRLNYLNADLKALIDELKENGA